MEQTNPISMGDLGNNQSSKLKTIIVTAILTAVILFAGRTIYDSYTQENLPSDAQVVSLQEVVIAYAPELKRIIFLDRKTGQVQFSLSDSVSMAIFALKSSEVVTDYSASLTNKNSSETSKK